MVVNFMVEGKPQGKARARTVRNKYTGKVHSFTPEKTQCYEDLVRWCYREAGGILFTGPVEVKVSARIKIPTSFTKKEKNAAILGTKYPEKKPDCDNILKVIMDALNGIAYTDDKQVVSVSCDKRYVINESHVFVTIYDL